MKRTVPIPPHVHLAGPQLAGWTPKVTPRPQYGVVCEPNVAIPLPDGTVLRADLYRPKAAGRFPALVAWSSYTKELQQTGLPLPINEVGVVGRIVARGYCHLTVTARGTGRSGGAHHFQFAPQEQQDAADTVEWVAAQAWCDGQVGMVGMSYFAIIQYLVAAKQPPHLKAIFPYLGLTDFYRHFAYNGGAPQAEFFARYYALLGSTRTLRLPATVRHALGYILDHEWVQWLFRWLTPIRTRLGGRGHPDEAWVRDFATLFFDQPSDGPFYWEKSAWPVLERIHVPVCLGASWGNLLHLRGTLEAWHRIRAPKTLFIGPREARWPWASYQNELLAWYDYHLKGIANGVDALPPVRYWLQGASRWRTAEDWPIPTAATRCLYLDRGEDRGEPNGLAEQRLLTEPPTQPTAVSYLAIPRHLAYPRELDRYETQVVRYASAPFERDVEVAGPVRLCLTLSSTALDTHVFARLSDRAPNGRSTTLSLGWVRAATRRQDAARSTGSEIVHDQTHLEPLVPGQPVLLDFSLLPTASLVRARHRLVLELASRPDLIPPSPSQGFVFGPRDAPPEPAPAYPARNVVYHGGGDPARIEFEVRTD